MGGASCCVIRFRFTKRRGKGTKRDREPGRGSNWKLCFIPGRGFAAGSCSLVRQVSQRSPGPLRFFFFFFLHAFAHLHLHSRCLPSLAPPPLYPFFRAVELPSMKKRLGRKSASCALRVFGHPPALILSLTETAHLQYRLRSYGPGTWSSLPPPIFTRTRIRLTGYGEGFPLLAN
jgi:hypothetical protein